MKNSMWVSLLVCFTLQGCALTGMMDVLSPDKPQIETNVQLGKTNNSEKSNIKLENGNTTSNQEAKDGGIIKNGGQEAKDGGRIENGKQEVADGGVIKNITQNIPIEYLLVVVLLAGWAVPSPKETMIGTKTVIKEVYGGVNVLTRDVFNAIIASPLKGIANFILKLLGREPL